MTKNSPNTDILSDILDRVAIEFAVTAKDRQRLERELRRQVGGEMHYIAKNGDGVRIEIKARDARIRADARRGESIRFLSRKHGLSVRRVQQILQGDQVAMQDCECETDGAKRFV